MESDGEHVSGEALKSKISTIESYTLAIGGNVKAEAHLSYKALTSCREGSTARVIGRSLILWSKSCIPWQGLRA